MQQIKKDIQTLIKAIEENREENGMLNTQYIADELEPLRDFATEWIAYPDLGCYYRLDGQELEFAPMLENGTRENVSGQYVDFELMKGEEIYPRLLEVKIE